MKSKRNFSWTSILTLLSYLIFALTLYTTISRILLWNILSPLINANVHRILILFSLSQVAVQVNITSLNSWICRGVILVAFLLLVIRIKNIRQRSFWMFSIPVIAILTLAGASWFWSVDNGFTQSRFYLLLAAALGGIYISFEFKKPKMIWFLEAFAALIVLGSLIMVLKYPNLAVVQEDPGPKNWFGLFSWKMPAATLMGFAATMFLFRVANFRNERWVTRIYSVIFYMLAVFLTFKARSQTEFISLVGVHIILVLAILYLRWGRLLKPVHWWILGAAGIMVLLGIWFSRGLWLGFFGRASNLTGRIPLWITLSSSIKQRLFFGYGFGEAFWKNSDYYLKVWQVVTWDPVFAHNGYIEALIDTGVVGLVFWILFLIQVCYMSLRYFSREHNLSALIFFAWLVFVAVSNIGNDHLGSYETFTWLLLVITFSFTLRDTLDRKRISSTTRAQT